MSRVYFFLKKMQGEIMPEQAFAENLNRLIERHDGQPYQIAAIRNIALFHHISFPKDCPVCTSP
jgi:hypothetical protein